MLRALSLLCLLVAGCRTAPPVAEPPPPPSDPAAVLASLRPPSVGTVYAELTLTVDAPERGGSFDAVVRWTPARLRLTAFKDLVLATRPIFDVALGPDGYAIDREGARDRGPLARFPAAHRELAAVFHAREALFLPGAGDDRSLRPVATDEGGRWSTRGRLRSGLAVTWFVDPATRRAAEATIETPDGPLRLRYRDWQAHGGRWLPGRVVLLHHTTSVEARLEELELDAPLPDEELALPSGRPAR